MEIGSVIREARTAKGWSQAELARRIGVRRQTVNKWEKGQAAPTRKRAPVVAQILGVELSALSADPRNADKRGGATVPLIDWGAAGRGMQLAYPDQVVAERVQVTFPVSESAFALEIKGDSMAPQFQKGDLILIDPTVTPRPSDYVVVRLTSSKECTFKKYIPRGTASDDTPVYDLVPLNPNFDTITISSTRPGEIVGTLVEHRKRYRRFTPD